MSSLRHAVVKMQERRSLSDERLRTLEMLQRRKPARAPTDPQGRQRLAWVAVFLAALMLPVLWWQLNPLRAPGPEAARLIAEEVAANHLHLKPLEVESGDITGIRRYFTQLDFLPVDSALSKLDGLDLLGGRYCSIRGSTAAQLRLLPSTGGPLQTLYQTRYDRVRFGPLPQLDQGESPLQLSVRGLEVMIWVEKDVLFALIREA